MRFDSSPGRVAETPEGKLTKKIVAAIKKKYPNAWVFKVVGHPYQMSGVPDLLVGLNGLCIALEVKDRKTGESIERARSRTSPQQEKQIRLIQNSGCWASVILTPEEALHDIAAAIQLAQEGSRSGVGGVQREGIGEGEEAARERRSEAGQGVPWVRPVGDSSGAPPALPRGYSGE